jgi:hypothetical protein
VKPSEPQKSRSRFRSRNAQKQPTQNTAAKKQARQENVESDYLFVDAKTEFPKSRQKTNLASANFSPS